jgi:hypothetical protein
MDGAELGKTVEFPNKLFPLFRKIWVKIQYEETSLL